MVKKGYAAYRIAADADSVDTGSINPGPTSSASPRESRAKATNQRPSPFLLVVGGLTVGWALLATYAGQASVGRESHLMRGQIVQAMREITDTSAAVLPRDESSVVSRILEINRGDTLASLLRNAGASPTRTREVVAALRDRIDLRALQPGQKIHVELDRTTQTTKLVKVALPVAPGHAIVVRSTKGGTFDAKEVVRPLKSEMVRAGGTIGDSLFDSALKAGIPQPIIAKMIKLFSYSVDFEHDIRPGDSFHVFFQRAVAPDGKTAKFGPLLYAAITLGDQTHRYYRFQPSPKAPASYYTGSGRSIRTALLRTPIDGARITSGFGMRKDPLGPGLEFHEGVDFAAPMGTPIMAAGDGVVVRVGWVRGYGKYIEIRHNSVYSTAYAHLSRYAKGLHDGERVRQGEVIGYVGSTGRSTGPHLDYEVHVNGKQVNPLTVRLPSRKVLAGAERTRFEQMVAQVGREMTASEAMAKAEVPAKTATTLAETTN